MNFSLTRLWLTFGSVFVGSSLLVLSPVSGQEIKFSRDIRPILSDKCFACHGPDDEHREGGLRFDLREGAFAEADSGEHAIVAGDLAKSSLVGRITTDDESEIMPPLETNKPLTADEIKKLTAWIEQGATWEDHWSFSAPKRPELPEVKQVAWSQNEIDAFILRRLEAEGLTPQAEADRATLIRRVTFDLTGLPPTPEEVSAFQNDNSADAYEKLVDRLLASPRFGEHRGRYWLDAVRYGDTHGLHLDNYREMWAYRDWVVDALNKNMPFDQFVVEQMAGDLLPNPTHEQLIATGFNRCNVTTSEGGSIRDEVHMRNVVDRVSTMGTVFLGLTFDCTRCHDHKFDPLTTTDFYSMYAFFNSIDGSPLDGNKKDHAPVLKVPTSEQQKQLDDFNQQLADLNGQFNGEWPAVDEAQLAWIKKLASESSTDNVTWEQLKPATFVSQGKADLKLLDDNSVLASGTNPAKEVYTLTFPVTGNDWKGIQLEGLIHESLVNGGHGRSTNSNVVMTGFEAYIGPAEVTDETQWKRIAIKAAKADHEQSNGDFKIANAIDDKPASGWATEGYNKKEDRTAIFEAAEPFGTEEPQTLKIVLKFESVHAYHQFGRVRISATKQKPIQVDLPAEILAIVKTEADKRDDAQDKKLKDHYRANVTKDAAYIAVRDQIAAVTKQRDGLQNSIPTTLIWKEKKEPVKAHILKRGEYDQVGEEVTRNTPGMLPPFKEEWSKDRLGLAQWLIAEENPLLARVTVNRLWQQFFGTGLVKTSEDFGSQGEPPSHPELLDWMAVQFRADGWDTKRMMKRMVMSATYRQSSRLSKELYERDPANRLLARGPRFRLDAEMLRDQALSVSGLLVEKMGGPSVKPPQPDGLWFAVGYSGSNTVRFKAEQGPDKVHRRTIYTFIKRTSPPPQMNTFDGPSRESCSVRRERTNTPLQALLLFNDPQFVECATGLALRAFREGGDTNEGVAHRMLSLCLGREPTDTEVNELVRGFESDLDAFQADPKAAEKLISIGIVPMDEKHDPAVLAAWTMAANLCLNLDEVLTKN